MQAHAVVLALREATLRACTAIAGFATLPAMVVALSAASAQAALGGQLGATVMPDGFGRVELGMQQAQLARARRSIDANAFAGDNTGHPKMLFEEVQTDFIDRVIYLFDDARPTLSDVVYLKFLRERDPQRSSLVFRAAVLRKWGLPDSAGRSQGDAGEPQVTLVWRHPNAVIVASYPSGTGVAGKSTGSVVRIGRRGAQADAFAAKLGSIDAAARARLMDELREQLGKTPASVTFK